MEEANKKKVVSGSGGFSGTYEKKKLGQNKGS